MKMIYFCLKCGVKVESGSRLIYCVCGQKFQTQTGQIMEEFFKEGDDLLKTIFGKE